MHAHLSGKDTNGIILPKKLLPMTGNWKSYLQEALSISSDSFEQHQRTGRPLDTEGFIEKAERLMSRELKNKKPGFKVTDSDD